MISRSHAKIVFPLVLVALIGWLMNGCAYNESGQADSGRQLKQNKVIENTYGPLVGTYEGTLEVAPSANPRGRGTASSVPVKMVIYFDNESVTNPDGTPGTNLVPRAYLGIFGNWGERYTLKVEGYARERGTVSMSNTLEPAKIAPDAVKTATLATTADGLRGDALSPSGPIGTLVLQLKSKDTSVPQESERERYDRMIEATYAPLVGTYNGTLSVPAGLSSAAQEVPVEMILYISTISATNPDGTPGFRKSPVAFVRIGGTWLHRYTFSVSGYAKEGDVISLDGAATAQGMVRKMLLNVAGKVLSGDVQSISGYIGTIAMEKINQNTTVPRDSDREQQEQLLAFYQNLAGVYKGVIHAPEKDVPISLELTIHELSGSYYLKGFYRRLDVPGIIDLTMDVTVYREEKPVRLGMQGKGNLNYFVSIEGRVVDGKFDGKLSTLKGPQGPVELRKK